MNKALMISIQPQNVVNVLNGDKDRELRKWIPKGYVGWVYVYVTKGKPYLYDRKSNDYKFAIKIEKYKGKIPHKYELNSSDYFHQFERINGKVAFRFWFDEYDEMEYVSGHYEINPHDIPLKLCLEIKQINDYGKGKTLYAWHIKKLEIFDEPKQLSEFYKRIDGLDENGGFILANLKDGEFVTIPELRKKYLLSKAPQRSVWVYV